METTIQSEFHTFSANHIDAQPSLNKRSELDRYDLTDVMVAIDEATMAEIRRLRKRQYRDIYPDMDLDNDLLDDHSITLYTRGLQGQINSTARLGFDGPVGLPEDEFLQAYRSRGFRLVEWGRFIIENGDKALLKRYYETVFTLSRRMGFDAVVMAMKPKDISLHQRLIGVDVVQDDMNINYGGPYSLACVVWDLASTKNSFFNWLNRK